MMISVITPTHDPRHLRETMKSLLAQTCGDWEWVVVANGAATISSVRAALGGMLDSRIRVERLDNPDSTGQPSIGAIKRDAFSRGRGEILVELDHDDLLTSDALAEIARAFEDQAIDFAYSNYTDFADGTRDQFYYYPNWERNGWRYRTVLVQVSGETREVAECISFEPSASMISLIYYAPNHARAWRREFYERVGGHDPAFAIADDHELLIRTYLSGRMKHVDRCLYLYRMGANNTYSRRLQEIRDITYDLHARNIEALALRDGALRGLPCFDLGGGFSCPPGWTSIDQTGGEITADLTQRWPFEDSSVAAFRAHDILEHLPDKQHAMSEIHRCLAPGGIALIHVPSTDGVLLTKDGRMLPAGRGAHQDPTHVSFWNQNSFWYWTRPQTAAYIRNYDKLFIERRLFTHFPSKWHEENAISYAVAELIAHKGDMTEVPGMRP